MSELNLKYNREPICPYCGNTYHDAWEIWSASDGDGATEEVDCDCGKSYVIELNIDITYSTYKKEKTKIKVPVNEV